MIIPAAYSLQISPLLKDEDLKKGCWLVILNACRTPPHVGLMFDGSYNSLTIKGHEINIDCSVLLKTTRQKKIEALFCKLKAHPVFSIEFQKDIGQLYIKQFKQVKANEASCLSPIKLFFQEFYALQENKTELLFELIERLKFNHYITQTLSLNIDIIPEGEFMLPTYSHADLQDIIKTERAIYYKE